MFFFFFSRYTDLKSNSQEAVAKEIPIMIIIMIIIIIIIVIIIVMIISMIILGHSRS